MNREIAYVSFVKEIVAIAGALAEIPQFPYTRECIYKKNAYNRKADGEEGVALIPHGMESFLLLSVFRVWSARGRCGINDDIIVRRRRAVDEK